MIDTSNYYPQRDGQIAEVDAGKPESTRANEQLGRPVIKTFNALLAHTLAERGAPKGSPGRLALPVAGDDATTKMIAMSLVEAIGFDAVDAGNLASSWRQQPGTPAYCLELTADPLVAALYAADKARAPRDRDTLMEGFMGPDSPTSQAEVVARNRQVTAP